MSEKFVFPIEAYRQGMDDERERITALLEELVSRMSALNKNTGYGAHSANMSIRIKALNLAIEQIKGENK